MNTPDLKSIVSNNKMVNFVRFRHGNLWYATEDGFEFPVPVADAGEATFHAQEKALLLMRYIRKHLADMATGKAESKPAL